MITTTQWSTFDQVPQDEQSVITRHSRSFSLASSLLPSAVRPDVRKLYAWCRWCDNAVDNAGSREEALKQVNALKLDVYRIYAGLRPVHAASLWLQELIAKYDLPAAWPLDLLAGMESDVDFELKASLADLEQYCYQAAGVVGLMMCRIFGVDDPQALKHACHLGMAMQLTNIARDVAEDWERGRFYLPQAWLALDAQSDKAPTQQQLIPVLQRVLRQADFHYRNASAGYAYLPPRVRAAVRIAAAVYRQIGNEIAAGDYRVMEQRFHVKKAKMLKLAAREWLAAQRSRISPTIPEPLRPFGETLMSNARKEMQYLATFGLSLTLMMATAMFLLVAVNPKMSEYGALPLVYSVGCALGASGLWFYSRRVARTLDTACRDTASK